MKIAVLGDLHLSRSLPHRKATQDGTNDRYSFRLALLKEAIQHYETVVLLGDVTDIPNMIDGRLMYDFVSLIGDRRIVQVLGNHDRHDSTGDVSMGEVLEKCLPRYQCYSKMKTVVVGKVCFIFAPYYASEKEIFEHVEAAAKTHEFTLVLGHWNFFDELYGGKTFSDAWLLSMYEAGVRFYLGHLHVPSEIVVGGRVIGAYLGAVSPVRFKEAQGKMMVVDTDKPSLSFVHYPASEDFIEIYFDGTIPDHDNDHKYLKVYYDGKKYDREELRKLLEPHCRTLLLVEESSDITMHKEELQRNEEETEESYLLSVAKEQGFKDPELLVKKHQEIKGVVE